MKLVFATNNAHKLQEVRQILPAAYELLSLHAIGFDREIEETGETLEENSRIKAREVWNYLLQAKPEAKDIDGVFADDTGLEVVALQGAPGVYSARYAGEPSDSAKNRKKLLEEMRNIADRRARFRTVVTYIDKCGEETCVEGEVGGCIAMEEHGGGGFGYDSLFIPNDYECTFAELSAAEKNSISNRGRAIENLRKYLSTI